jgi:hypothetical protein
MGAALVPIVAPRRVGAGFASHPRPPRKGNARQAATTGKCPVSNNRYRQSLYARGNGYGGGASGVSAYGDALATIDTSDSELIQ